MLVCKGGRGGRVCGCLPACLPGCVSWVRRRLHAGHILGLGSGERAEVVVASRLVWELAGEGVSLVGVVWLCFLVVVGCLFVCFVVGGGGKAAALSFLTSGCGVFDGASRVCWGTWKCCCDECHVERVRW